MKVSWEQEIVGIALADGLTWNSMHTAWSESSSYPRRIVTASQRTLAGWPASGGPYK